MKSLSVLLFLAVAAVQSAVAQQTKVEIVTEDDHFLVHEELVVAVRVTNFSGQTLHLGKDDEWLRFSLEGDNNYVVPKLADPPVTGEFTLESSKVGTRRVNLAPWFGLTRPGKYRVTATVKFAELSREQSSEPKAVFIVSGRNLWEQQFGVPHRSGQPDGEQVVRKYSLVQATQRDQIKLYFRLGNQNDTVVLRTTPFSSMTSFSRPEPQLDRSGQLHVLNQYHARSFHYCVFGPDGDFILRQTFEHTSTRPSLRADEDGKIRVVGGVRRPNATDIPPTTTAATNENDSPKNR